MPPKPRKQPQKPRFESEDDDPAVEEYVRGWQPPQALIWFLLLLLVGLVLTHSYIKDHHEPWDEDLITALDTVEDHLPPASRLKVMLLSVQDPVAMREDPVWNWEIQDLEPVVAQYGDMLANFSDLLSDSQESWDKTSVVWRHEDLGRSQLWDRVITIKQAQVFYLKLIGQEARAFSAAIDLAQLGYMLEQLEAWPSFFQRAIDCHLASARCLGELLRQTQLSEEKLRYFQEEEYQLWEPSLNHFSTAMEGFYSYEKKLLMGPRPDEPPLPASAIPVRQDWVFFKPNATLQLFAQSFRELKDAALVTPFPLANQIAHRVHKPVDGIFRLSNPNWSGEQYFALRMEQYLDFPDQFLFARAGYVSVMHLFAFRRYILKELSVPENLSDLYPKYLTKKMVDPFMGEPLRYHLEKGVIYSPGRDFMDEAGDPESSPLLDWNEPTLKIGLGVASARN